MAYNYDFSAATAPPPHTHTQNTNMCAQPLATVSEGAIGKKRHIQENNSHGRALSTSETQQPSNKDDNKF